MFDKLIGNDHVKEMLARIVSARRVPNAFLFAGTEGVGKRQFALELAKSFVCQKPAGGEACDACPACRRTDNFNFPKPDERDEHKKVIFSENPDVGMVIPYNRNILVDAVRHLEEEANFLPFQAKARFFLIDRADRMNLEASNALLKTLEEPPATSHIFLITSRPDSLLQTIRSRCQTIRFAPIPAGEIEDYLRGTKKFSPDDAALIARLSAGSIGRALNLDLTRFREQRSTMLKALDGLLLQKNNLALLKTGEEMSDGKNKDDFETYLEILQTLIHDIWTLRLGADRRSLVNIDLEPHLGKLAAAAESRRLANWIREIETVRENLAVNLNKKIAADALFMQMAGA